VRHLPAGDRGRPDGEPGGVVELVQADEEEVGELGRQWSRPVRRRTGCRLRPTSSSVKNALPSARSTMRRRSVSGSGAGCRRADELAHLGIAERRQHESRDPGEAGPLRHRGAQRVPAVQVVAAVGRDDRHRRAEAPGEQEAQQLAGGLVGPVDVLEQQQHGRGRAELHQRGVDRLEQLGPVDLGPSSGDLPARKEPGSGGADVDERGGQSRLLAGEPGERLAEGDVREGAVGEVETVADQDAPSRRGGALAELAQQPRLADTGVAGEQDHRVARLVVADADEPGQAGELVVAPDERAAPSGCDCTSSIIAARYRQRRRPSSDPLLLTRRPRRASGTGVRTRELRAARPGGADGPGAARPRRSRPSRGRGGRRSRRRRRTGWRRGTAW
jgi:hypothetical protein